MSDARTLERRKLRGRNDEVVEVDAVLLGYGSSFQDGKVRWFEVSIYADSQDEYVVHTVGRTTLPGESDRCRVERTSSPFEVAEILTVRVVSARQGTLVGDRRAPEPYIPRPSMRALAQAAEFDEGLLEAYKQVA